MLAFGLIWLYMCPGSAESVSGLCILFLHHTVVISMTEADNVTAYAIVHDSGV